MVHIDCGGDNGGSRYFYDNITGRGVDFDLIGLSYYPFWHGPLAKLSSNLNDLSMRYGKGVMVVETSYPWTLPAADNVRVLRRASRPVARDRSLPRHAIRPGRLFRGAPLRRWMRSHRTAVAASSTGSPNGCPPWAGAQARTILTQT